jgi:hypothetical protein
VAIDAASIENDGGKEAQEDGVWQINRKLSNFVSFQWDNTRQKLDSDQVSEEDGTSSTEAIDDLQPKASGAEIAKYHRLLLCTMDESTPRGRKVVSGVGGEDGRTARLRDLIGSEAMPGNGQACGIVGRVA